MNAPETTEERVIRAIKKVLRNKEVHIDNTFEELEIDSLSANEILFEVEDEFDIDIPDESVRDIRCVRDVVRGAERLMEGKAANLGGGTASTGEESKS